MIELKKSISLSSFSSLFESLRQEGEERDRSEKDKFFKVTSHE